MSKNSHINKPGPKIIPDIGRASRYINLMDNKDSIFYVYVLKNTIANRKYIGQTNDLDRRISEHNGTNTNPRRYTSKFSGKWELVYFEEYQTRSEAMKREKWLKSGTGRNWLSEKIE